MNPGEERAEETAGPHRFKAYEESFIFVNETLFLVICAKQFSK